MLPLTLLALVVGTAEQAYALRSSSVPEDLFAYPKYSIHFLNGQPVLNDTAQRWLQHGIVDEDEFLGHQRSSKDASKLFKGIAGGPEDAELATAASPPTEAPAQAPTVQKMKLGPSDYLCLLPPPPHIPSSDEDTQQAPKPISTWELLQPLEGTCLYVCSIWGRFHYPDMSPYSPSVNASTNSSIAKGGLAMHTVMDAMFGNSENWSRISHSTPAEDPNEPSYTLGHAPAPAKAQQDHESGSQHLSVADRTAIANRLELARGAGQRYLSLYMGDGTVCDKSGQPRQVNVQFHCNAAPRDMISWIKENKTCSYTLVIHTPRLCNEPGFKDARENLADTPLRCRKIVDKLEGTDPTLPESPSPFERRKPKPLPAPRKDKTKDDDKKGATTSGADEKLKDAQAKMIKAALDALLGRKGKDAKGNGATDGAAAEGGGDAKLRDSLTDKIVAVSIDDNGEIQILDTPVGAGGKEEKVEKDKAAAAPTLRNDQLGDDDGDVMEIELADGEDAVRLMKILRDAGFDARFPTAGDDEKEGKHDEL